MWKKDYSEENILPNGSAYGWREKPNTARSPQSAKSENKTLKRKLFSPGNNSHSEDEGDKKTTPKRRRSLATCEGSPSPGCTGVTPKTPGGTPRFMVPLSERQQLALLMQMTAEESQQQTGGEYKIAETSPQPLSPHSTGKRTPSDKKINKRNERGETALHVAAIKGNVKQTKRLIKAGADVNIKDYAGWTPLHEACNHGWLDVARQLLRAGANVNVQGYGNDTPLHDSAINGHQKLVELLLRHGANPLQVNCKGKAPLDVAANDTITQLLRNEIIASSSSSSSTDDIRSPTSPESNVSEDDYKKLDKGNIDLSSSSSLISEGLTRQSSLTSHSLQLHNTAHPPSTYSSQSVPPHTLSPAQGFYSNPNIQHPPSNILTSAPTHTSSIFKKVTVSHHMDKSSSPRLMLKFQHIKTKEKCGNEMPKKSRNDSPYKSYSVTLGTKDRHGPYSPVGSSSSQDSDLYDPQLEITTYGSRRNLHSVMQRQSQAKSPLQNLPFGAAPSVEGMFHMVSSNNCVATDLPSMAVSKKGKTDSTMDTSHSGLDSQMPTLSQESGPFTPRFEDISDDEERDEPIESDAVKISSTPLSSVTTSASLANIPRSSSSGRNNSSVVCASDSLGHLSPAPGVFGVQLCISPHTTMHHDGAPTHAVQTDHIAPSGASSMSTNSNFVTKQQDCKQRTKESHYNFHSHMPYTAPLPGNVTSKLFPPVKCESQYVSHSSQSLIKTEPKSPVAYHNVDSNCSSQKDDLKVSPADCVQVKIEHETTSVKPGVRTPCLKQVKLEVEQDKHDDSHSPKPEPSESNVKLSSYQWSPSAKTCKEGASPSSAVRPCLKMEVGDMSPKADRDSPKSDTDSKSSCPKVPPLKIIIPANTSASSVGSTQHLKTITSKPALPYVLRRPNENVAHSTSGIELGCVVTHQTLAQLNPYTSATIDCESRELKIDLKENEPLVLDENITNRMSSSDDIDQLAGRRVKPRLMVQKGMHKDQAFSLLNTTADSAKDNLKETKAEDSNSDTNSREGQKREDEPPGERRMTRAAMRSQQLQQLNQTDKEKEENLKIGKVEKDKDKEADNSNNQGNAGRTLRSDAAAVNPDDIKMHPRKRKLRQRQQQEQMGLENSIQQNTNHVYDQQQMSQQTQQPEKPGNPFEMYLNIRKKVANRHSQWLAVVPKAPQGFKDYLMVSCNYVLQGNSASRLSIPMLTPPNSLIGPMRDLFVEQERSRYNMRLQHLIQRDKLRLSTEQETLRVHARAARAMANQNMPLSACSILRDEDIYNPLDINVEDRDKTSRSRFNGRQLLSWLQDVDDKFEKLKESLLLRHHHEAESLHAFQLLEWEWRTKEHGLSDARLRPNLDELNVPLVHISDEFDLLPP